MIKVYKENVVQNLFALADYDYQKRVWRDMKLQHGDTAISFVEGCCTVYDDTGLGDALDAGQTVFGEAADQALVDLSNTLKSTKPGMPDRLFIDTPAMQNIRDKAQNALRLILQSDFS